MIDMNLARAVGPERPDRSGRAREQAEMGASPDESAIALASTDRVISGQRIERGAG